MNQDCIQTLEVAAKTYHYFSLPHIEKSGWGQVSRLPFSLKVLLENLLRHQDGLKVKEDDAKTLANWTQTAKGGHEIAYHPSRVLMQDFTGVPAIVDLAAMRDALQAQGKPAKKINPLSQVDLVIDHSVTVEAFGTAESFKTNVEIEFQRNQERYSFLHWGQKAFDNFRVVPPGTGICHQVNLEYLGKTVAAKKIEGKDFAFPDTLVGTDSHTTMINALSILGWGVGGIEAEAAMLGQPVSMLLPEVVGFRLQGKLAEGVTATDLVLTVTQMLRRQGVVGKFVEFFGPGLSELTLADRATISNMSPEFGSTCCFFPTDSETLNYLSFTGRDPEQVKLVQAYAKAQGLWRDDQTPDPTFSDVLELDLKEVVPSVAGPKRPQDKIDVKELDKEFKRAMKEVYQIAEDQFDKTVPVEGEDFSLSHGDVTIAAITSCTNTSNPSVMIAAGLVARKARQKGLKVKPWVKTSLAPGSQVVTDYLLESGLQEDLDGLGFNLVGYGCTTCIGNSGPLPEKISQAIHREGLCVASVLSGNRNFEGRIGPDVKANFLASPPLVVAYALTGTVQTNIFHAPLGRDQQGQDVYLQDIWPSADEIKNTIKTALTPAMFASRYSNVFEGEEVWRSIKTTDKETYDWQAESTYIKRPPFFEDFSPEAPAPRNIQGAKALAILGDSVTTDHISPAGAIGKESPAGQYLQEKGIAVKDFNSFGSRRGNHEVMMRGTFGNIRIKNEMLQGVEGGHTLYQGKQMPIYDAAMKHQTDGTPLVVVAGKEYGTGSSRDWAAKGTKLLGVKAVIAESYERIHRSNLIGMGVLPLQFKAGSGRQALGLNGQEEYSIEGLEGEITPAITPKLIIHYPDKSKKEELLDCRLDTETEVEYYLQGGILDYVLRSMLTP